MKPIIKKYPFKDGEVVLTKTVKKTTLEKDPGYRYNSESKMDYSETNPIQKKTTYITKIIPHNGKFIKEEEKFVKELNKRKNDEKFDVKKEEDFFDKFAREQGEEDEKREKRKKLGLEPQTRRELIEEERLDRMKQRILNIDDIKLDEFFDETPENKSLRYEKDTKYENLKSREKYNNLTKEIRKLGHEIIRFKKQANKYKKEPLYDRESVLLNINKTIAKRNELIDELKTYRQELEEDRRVDDRYEEFADKYKIDREPQTTRDGVKYKYNKDEYGDYPNLVGRESRDPTDRDVKLIKRMSKLRKNDPSQVYAKDMGTSMIKKVKNRNFDPDYEESNNNEKYKIYDDSEEIDKSTSRARKIVQPTQIKNKILGVYEAQDNIENTLFPLIERIDKANTYYDHAVSIYSKLKKDPIKLTNKQLNENIAGLRSLSQSIINKMETLYQPELRDSETFSESEGEGFSKLLKRKALKKEIMNLLNKLS